MKTKILILACLIGPLFFSCQKKSITPNPNEEELITTVQLKFIDSSGIEPTIYCIYQDKDGDGGNLPEKWDSIILKANKCYYMTITLLDETKIPIDTISNEILSEDYDHLFCFEPLGVSIDIEKTDKDKNELSLGLKSKWNTYATGNGSIDIILKHQPGIKNGDCNIGATDIHLTFPIFIK